jgi:hypothetical protein
MEKLLLQEMSAEERLQTLKDSADKIEDFSYTKPFTPGQIIVFKDKLSTVMIEYSAIEDELKAVKEEYASKMKPMKDETKDLLKNIKNKADFVTEKCFLMVEGDQVGYYNAAGELVYCRPLLPGEKQKTVFSVLREATNG